MISYPRLLNGIHNYGLVFEGIPKMSMLVWYAQKGMRAFGFRDPLELIKCGGLRLTDVAFFNVPLNELEFH